MAEEEHHQYSVKIVEVCMVAPASPPPLESAAPMSLPLTFLDLALLRYPPTQRIYFYENTLLTDTDSSSLSFIVPKLKHSLSLILQHYLPLAGNLIWPQDSHKPIIQFQGGDGVSLTVAESDADFQYLAGYGFREATAYPSLVPQLPSSHDSTAVIALQITLFQDKGFSIGISSHHAILDGRTSTSFIKSWARICNLHVTGSGEPSSSFPMTSSELMPFYDRTTIHDPVRLEAIYLNAWLNMDGPNNRSLKLWSFKTQPDLVRCTLELSGQNLKKLKQYVLNKRQNMKKQHQEEQNQSFHLSSFTVTCAYLLICVAKSKDLREKKMVFIFPVDVRSRLEPSLPTNFFGNCIVPRSSIFEGNEILSENGMMVATEKISEAIKSLKEEVFKGAENKVLNQNSMNIDEAQEYISMVIIGGSPRFEVYNADFGWGKPKKVQLLTTRTGIFSLTDSRNGDGGIEIGLLQQRNVMESFAASFAQGLQDIFENQETCLMEETSTHPRFK